MKKLRLYAYIFIICFVTVISATLFTKDIDKAQAAVYVRLSDKSLSLELGHYKTLMIYGTAKKASWRSSNNWVATVSSTGKVRAKATGTATISAYVNGKKLTCKLYVIRIKNKTMSLAPGQSGTLKITGPVLGSVTWSSSDPSIASVSDSGEVTAAAPGTTIITAVANGKSLSSTISVVSLSDTDVIMEYGGFSGYSKTLKVNNTSSPVTWSSSDTSVATVSSTGKVSAKGPGSVTITAAVDNAVLTCNIRIIGVNARQFTLKMGETMKLEILGTDSQIVWHSNKKSVALVTDDGTVSTVAPGSATIMANVDGRTVLSKVTVVE